MIATIDGRQFRIGETPAAWVDILRNRHYYRIARSIPSDYGVGSGLSTKLPLIGPHSFRPT
jgi:hypothetical protein